MFRELARWVVCFLTLAGLVLGVVLLLRTGIVFRMRSPRLVLLPCLFLLAGVISAGAAFAYRIYALTRGRRDRSDGISCVACDRRAFPVEGTTNRYRCGICKCRF